MEYKISEVVSVSEQTYGQYGNHRIVVKFEGNEANVSMFAKAAPAVGSTISGEIKVVEKDGKKFTNFEVAKKGAVDNKMLQDTFQNTEFILNRLTGLKLTLDAIDARTAHLAPQKAPVSEKAYPVNDAPEPFPQFPTEDINPDDVPF